MKKKNNKFTVDFHCNGQNCTKIRLFYWYFGIENGKFRWTSSKKNEKKRKPVSHAWKHKITIQTPMIMMTNAQRVYKINNMCINLCVTTKIFRWEFKSNFPLKSWVCHRFDRCVCDLVYFHFLLSRADFKWLCKEIVNILNWNIGVKTHA